MPATISIWTNEDTSEAGPTVDEERMTFTVDDLDHPTTDLHLVTDGAHGLWTVMVKLSPKTKADLLLKLQGCVCGPKGPCVGHEEGWS